MDKVINKKAEIFDIIVEQEKIKVKFDQLEKIKIEKINELKKLLEDNKENKNVKGS